MCRTYTFFFEDCEHNTLRPEWIFPCSSPGNDGCRDTSFGCTLLSFCLECLSNDHTLYSTFNHPLSADHEQKAMAMVRTLLAEPDFSPDQNTQHPLCREDRAWLAEWNEDINALIGKCIGMSESIFDTAVYPLTRSTLDEMIGVSLNLTKVYQGAVVSSMELAISCEEVNAEVPERVKAILLERVQELLTPASQEKLTHEDLCPICWEPLLEDNSEEGEIEASVKLPCGHIFGKACIEKFLTSDSKVKKLCPVCRHDYRISRLEALCRIEEMDRDPGYPPMPSWLPRLINNTQFQDNGSNEDGSDSDQQRQDELDEQLLSALAQYGN